MSADTSVCGLKSTPRRLDTRAAAAMRHCSTRVFCVRHRASRPSCMLRRRLVSRAKSSFKAFSTSATNSSRKPLIRWHPPTSCASVTSSSRSNSRHRSVARRVTSLGAIFILLFISCRDRFMKLSSFTDMSPLSPLTATDDDDDVSAFFASSSTAASR